MNTRGGTRTLGMDAAGVYSRGGTRSLSMGRLARMNTAPYHWRCDNPLVCRRVVSGATCFKRSCFKVVGFGGSRCLGFGVFKVLVGFRDL